MCDWLPGLITLSGHSGDWNRYLEALYNCFADDFIRVRPFINGKPVVIDNRCLLNGKELTFWHIISEGKTEEDRVPNLRRCECIRWPRAIIDHAGGGCVKYWEDERKGENRSNLWLEPADYHVVLVKKPDYYLLLTGFLLYGEHNRAMLRKEHDAWIKAGAARHG